MNVSKHLEDRMLSLDSTMIVSSTPWGRCYPPNTNHFVWIRGFGCYTLLCGHGEWSNGHGALPIAKRNHVN